MDFNFLKRSYQEIFLAAARHKIPTNINKTIMKF